MKLKHIIAASAVLGSVSAANAQVAGSFILTGGWTHLRPQQNASSSLGKNPTFEGIDKSRTSTIANGEPVNTESFNQRIDKNSGAGTEPIPIMPLPFPEDGAKLFPIVPIPTLRVPRPSPPNQTGPSVDLSGLINGGVRAGSASAFGLSATYFITDNVATELSLSTPTNLSLKGTDEFGQLGKIGSVRIWSPALLLKYYFLNAENTFRPYLGVGVSHTWFSKARLDLPESVPGTTSLTLKNKWAPVFNGGFSYQFTERLFGNVSVSYMPLKARAITRTTVHRENPYEKVTAIVSSSDKLKFNPITTFVGIGYRF